MKLIKTKEERKAIKAEKKAKGLGVLNEFKKFIMRGNVIDMAVGVIVATSFTQIVSSLTNGIFMPLITWLIGDIKFDEVKTVLRPEQLASDGTVAVAEIALKWGVVIANVINFILIALVIFTIIKIINNIRSKMTYYKDKMVKVVKQENMIEAPSEPETPTAVEVVEPEPTTTMLLLEIIELLKEKKKDE